MRTDPKRDHTRRFAIFACTGFALLLMRPVAEGRMGPDEEDNTPARLEEIELQIDRLKAELEDLQADAVKKDKAIAKQKRLKTRLEKLEVKAAQDRIRFTGDLRVAADSIHATQAARYDGLALQKGIVDTLFYYGSTGAFPGSLDAVNQHIAGNYGDYLFFQDNLTFDQIKQAMAMFQPAQIEGLMRMLLPSTYVPQRDYTNNIWYTTRLRLNMNADIMEDFTFAGRLSMYKTWGDSTGVQVFNGTPNTFTLDGTDAGVPNSDLLRVERAYFSWNKIGGSGLYLSAGRRPSTGGPPLQTREGERRQGTPNGHVIDFQFDGITIGYNLNNWLPGNTFRFCYGLGFESGFGSGDQLKAPADRMDDVHLGGINWDIYNTDEMRVQVTALGAWKVTDGFNGLIVLPTDPVSGNAIRAPVVLRYTPSENLGDIYMGDLLLERSHGSLTWFASGAFMKSDPEPVTSPFGGLFSDPFEMPEKQNGWSIYAGLRYDMTDNDTIGAEYNYGSQYWFNFTQGADDLVYSKLGTRGSVYEGYYMHKFRQGMGRARAKFLLRGMYYDYDYSGSGWHVGAPQELDGDQPPILGFPTYLDALDIRAEFTVKF